MVYTDLDDWYYKVINIDNVHNFANPDNFYHDVYKAKCDAWLVKTILLLAIMFGFINTATDVSASGQDVVASAFIIFLEITFYLVLSDKMDKAIDKI